MYFLGHFAILDLLGFHVNFYYCSTSMLNFAEFFIKIALSTMMKLVKGTGVKSLKSGPH